MRYLPYAVGGFMLLPLIVWLVLWSVFFPGPKHGLDVPLTAALLATSMPLVLWFFLANLGFLANSIGGTSEYDKPSQPLARHLVAALPWMALAIGLLSLPYLYAQGAVSGLTVLPLLSGLAIFYAIRTGEQARAADKGRALERTKDASQEAARESAGPSALQRAMGWVMKLVYTIPLLGWLIEDAVKGRESARLFFALNCAFAWLAAIAVFGYPAIILPALALVPLVFAGIFWTTRA